MLMIRTSAFDRPNLGMILFRNTKSVAEPIWDPTNLPFRSDTVLSSAFTPPTTESVLAPYSAMPIATSSPLAAPRTKGVAPITPMSIRRAIIASRVVLPLSNV